jgi:hypothetical protein
MNTRIDEFAKWEPKDWEQYILDNAISLPTDESGGQTAEEYARALAHAFKQRFPMVDLINGVEKSQVVTGKRPPNIGEFEK